VTNHERREGVNQPSLLFFERCRTIDACSSVPTSSSAFRQQLSNAAVLSLSSLLLPAVSFKIKGRTLPPNSSLSFLHPPPTIPLAPPTSTLLFNLFFDHYPDSVPMAWVLLLFYSQDFPFAWRFSRISLIPFYSRMMAILSLSHKLILSATLYPVILFSFRLHPRFSRIFSPPPFL
jgi:hypothetical protein